jgi:hypothetical protein
LVSLAVSALADELSPADEALPEELQPTRASEMAAATAIAVITARELREIISRSTFGCAVTANGRISEPNQPQHFDQAANGGEMR